MKSTSEEVGNLGEELQSLKQRLEKLEAFLLGQSGEEGVEEIRLTNLFRWQQHIPHLMDYDVWSVILAKKQGTDHLRSGYSSGGGDYAKVVDIPPEDAANLAGALSHPARILILRECRKAAQYPSDLEKTVSTRYGALYHHLNSLVEANLIVQEKERGKYVATSAGKTALMFINILASVIASIEVQTEELKTEVAT